MIRKRLTAFLSVLLILTVSAGFNVFAYDIDFSVKPQESSAKQGESVNVNIVVTTHEQGYTEFEMQLLYDEAVFSCESTYNDNGYVGSGKNGVYTLIYKDPSIDEPAPTQSGDVITIPVKFSVLSEATMGDTKLSASVIKCNGVNSLDLNSPVKLELAQLLSKTIKIEEGEPEEAVSDDKTTGEDSQTDDNSLGSLIEQPQITTEEEDPSYDWIEIVGIIIGGIVVFFSGCVVGYLFRQKKSGGSSREDYYSPSSRRSRHSSYDSDDIDIGGSSSDYSGISGVSKSNATEPTQGSRTYGGSQTNTARSTAPQYASNTPVPPVSIASENTLSGLTSTTDSYAAGYKQAPMQTSYATGALQTAPHSQSGFNSGNAGQQAQNPYSAVAPKTYTSGSYSQPNGQWPNQSYATPQAPFNASAQQASTFSVQQNSAQATSFNGNQNSQIEMAYRGEGTVGTYRPTPPTQGAYAPAYSQFAPTHPQPTPSASQQNTTNGYQPSVQKAQQPPFKTEYTIGRPGYGTPSGQATQQGYSTSRPSGGSYIQQAANAAHQKQSAQPQASVQNRFLNSNQQSGAGYNNPYSR